jgi:hypothetical protein
LSFWGSAIIQIQHCPLDETTASSETQLNQYEERPIAGNPPKTSMILAFKKTYQKLSSNGFDLAELEPKPVDHRQISIDPASAQCQGNPRGDVPSASSKSFRSSAAAVTLAAILSGEGKQARSRQPIRVLSTSALAHAPPTHKAHRAPTTLQLFSRLDSRAAHAHTLLPAALTSVPFGFVLVRARVRVHARRKPRGSYKFQFSPAPNSAESFCGVAAFVVNSESHTGAPPSLRLRVGLITLMHRFYPGERPRQTAKK